MKKIFRLDKSVAEMIAAGEVVERPASAVKELLENSIDAGARAVTLEIKNGGVAFIRVTDNGCGISREDLPEAFMRHATSKVRSASDLEAIGTLGFRGEALASIAAVSHVEMITRTADELSGSRVEIDGGETKKIGDAGCPVGTTVIVRDLFYNTPARMKFLKKDVSEANAVAAVAQRIALSHPDVSVKFIRDGRQEMLTPGDSRLISAVQGAFGSEFARTLIPVDYELGGVRVTGYTAKPATSRGSRSMQTFFINGRLIRSRTAAAALEEAYKGTVMTGRFPACVLCLALSPSLVDVNVHPAKLEVRFANEKQIFDAVYYAVKNAVAALDTPPEMKLKPPAEMLQLKASLAVSAPQRSTFSPHARDPFGSAAFVRTPDAPKPQMSIPLSAERETGMNLASTVHPVYEPLSGKTRSGAESAPPRAGGEAPEQSGAAAAQGAVPQGAVPAARVIGQCFSTYIVVESGGELLLIDKHAAHERIIYEQLKKSGASCAQQLIEPLTIEFTPEEHEVLAMNLPLLAKAGFEAEDFGGRSLIVRSVPPYLAAGEAAAVLTETAAGLAAGRRELAPQKLDELYHSVACRAAVKGGDRTGADELASIAERVLAIGDIRYCPHGRPVVIAIKRADIEKQFGRRG